jgi:hypothetical protein
LAHGQPCKLVAAILFAAVITATKISWQLKQAEQHMEFPWCHRAFSKIPMQQYINYFATSLYQAHSFVTETLWWWLALPRKRCVSGLPLLVIPTTMKYYIFAKQSFSYRLPLMTKYYIMREYENIHSCISL